MIFGLAQDLHDAVAVMPKAHSRRRMLELLEEAIRRDIHFINRHPTALFQCMWNTCWWHDSPAAADAYEEPEGGWKEPPPWRSPGDRLSRVLQSWKNERRAKATDGLWVQSLRPPHPPLDVGNVACLRGHQGPVRGTAFSPCGRWMATAAEDRTVIIWEVGSGRLVQRLHGHCDDIDAVVFLEDGRILAGCDATTIRVWDVASGQLIQERGTPPRRRPSRRRDMPDHRPNRTRQADLARRPAAGLSDDELSELLERKLARLLMVRSGEGTCLCGGSLASVSAGWNCQPTAPDSIEQEIFSPIAFSPDGRQMASVGGAGFRQVLLWDLLTGRLLREWDGHSDGVRCVAFSPDGHSVASGSADHTVRLWRVTGRSDLVEDEDSTRLCPRVVYDAPRRRFITCGSNICFWDTTGRKLTRWEAGRVGLAGATVSADGRLMACYAVDEGRIGSLIVAEAADKGRVRWQERGKWNWQLGPQFSPDGLWLLADSRLFRTGGDSRSSHFVRGLEGNPRLIQEMFSPDGRHVLGLGRDGTVGLWRTGDGTAVRSLPTIALAHDAAFTPDGQRILAAHVDGMVREWSPEVDHPLSERPGSDATAAALQYPVGLGSVVVEGVATLVQTRSNEAAGWMRRFDGPSARTGDGRVWAGVTDNRLCVFRLEGRPVCDTCHDAAESETGTPDSS